MSNDEAPEVMEDEPTPRRAPWLIGIVVLLAALAGGGYYWHSHRAAADSEAKTAANKPEIFLAMDPPFVVTLRDGDALRYLQVGVTLMAHDQAAIGVAKDVDPILRDGLVSLFSSQKFETVSETAGREKLQADALAEVRKVVAKRLGRPGIDALYFTSFVIQ
ncbi:MAG: flagellar basal body-associated FliL family protein [Rhodanobacter sp.]|jgi:flagellar FliL protein